MGRCPRSIKYLIIGIHRVACPNPQSSGATNSLGSHARKMGKFQKVLSGLQRSGFNTIFVVHPIFMKSYLSAVLLAIPVMTAERC